MAFEKDGIPQYSIDEVKTILKDGSRQPIDVRTQEEYETGHIPGVPRRTMQELAEWINELDPNGPYVFICRSGGRSQQVAKALNDNGFSDVANMVGGMLAWDGDVKEGSEA